MITLKELVHVFTRLRYYETNVDKGRVSLRKLGELLLV